MKNSPLAANPSTPLLNTQAPAAPPPAAPVVVEPPPAPQQAKPEADRRNKPKKLPPYNVVLLNDDDHTYEYVLLMLRTVFGFPFEKGFQLAREVDSQGRVILLTTTKEHAELKRDQIHSYGKDPLLARSKGSMSAIIEPVEG